jgi:hypothetical protein
MPFPLRMLEHQLGHNTYSNNTCPIVDLMRMDFEMVFVALNVMVVVESFVVVVVVVVVLAFDKHL